MDDVGQTPDQPSISRNARIELNAAVSALGSLLSNPVIQLVESRYAWALSYGG